MKTGTLKVGVKGAEAVKVPVQDAETIEDLTSLARGNAEVIVRWANRGHRIECQERSGARDALREARAKGEDNATVEKKVAELVANFDPTAKAARGGPRGPKQVTIKAGPGGKIDQKSFLEQLRAAGVQVNITTEQ